MNSKSKYNSFIGLNLALIMISTSGVLGRPLQMDPEVSIFWRCLLATFILGTYLYFRKADFSIKFKQDFNLIMIGGGLMGFHWVTYFYSLSLANVAIAILTLHTFPAMTAILEPLILKTKFRLYHLILASLVMLGIYIISPSMDLGDDVVLAVLFGLFSAFSYALRNIFTRKVMPNYNGSSMMFFQLCIMTFMLIPFLFMKSSAELLTHDWPFILGLAVLTTCIGHTLLVVNLKNYSAVTVSLMSSIIPVYGILWPFIFLSEVPSQSTMIGGAFILVSFFVEGYMSNREKA